MLRCPSNKAEAFKLNTQKSFKEMIEPINNIINQMKETLYLDRTNRQELERYIDLMDEYAN
jgi:hypothetical protein